MTFDDVTNAKFKDMTPEQIIEYAREQIKEAIAILDALEQEEDSDSDTSQT